MKSLFICIMVCCLGNGLMAEDKAESKVDISQEPCRKVMDACKAAIFSKNNVKEKKAVFKDCMQPLLSEPSEKVEGVNLDPALISACREKKQKNK